MMMPLDPDPASPLGDFAVVHDFDAQGQLAGKSGDAVLWSWRNYTLVDARARRNLQSDESLPATIRDALLSPGDQFQISYDEGWMFGELPDLQHEHYGDPRELGYFRFAFNGTQFLSGRKHPLQAVDDTKRAIQTGKLKPARPLELFNAIFRRFLDLLRIEITSLSATLDSIEDRIVGENWQGERERLVPVRRQIVVFHRYLSAATALFRDIDHADRRSFPEDIDDLIEDLSRRAVTLHGEGEQLQRRARLLQDELLAKMTDRSNRLLYILSVMTAVLLPTTVISGLFGMNTGGLPFAESSRGFAIVSFVALAVSLFVFLAVRKIGGSGR
ncbi:magnesium transporter CorA [Phyllobacterium sp. 0TCS1.6C]|uniref:CorA family divalent cation transporter n=2 Tax=unclassified Phyllobacterium TaxID=2638441 RepID=UPI002264EAC8|nr:CorA family divalent cation transporter [Phyllobacterium sp. 0TCS1.6C]MCX8280515.1 magnesium transporter CorA [Phyllobacterium sp. 0TCS1.6C]MCX8295036.1 magnesium transporter CorA [Phyllobacterium sp. 0TCS1.6A]